MSDTPPFARALAASRLTQAEFGKRLGLRQSAISKMVSGAMRVPPIHCRVIEQLSGGTVSRYELRPDVFGASPTD